MEGLSPAGTKEVLLWIVRLRRRARIRGESMLPHLRPGDEVLVNPYAYRRTAPRPGEIVLALHPYQRDLKLVKRVEAVLEGDRYRLTGDNPSDSTDSRTFGAIPRQEILGRVTSIFSRNR